MKSFVGRRDLHSLLNAEQLPGESFARRDDLPALKRFAGGNSLPGESFGGGAFCREGKFPQPAEQVL